MKVYEISIEDMNQWNKDQQRTFWLNLCEWCRTNIGQEGVDWKLQSSGYDAFSTAAASRTQRQATHLNPGIVLLNGEDLANEVFTDMIMYAKLGLQLF